VCERGEREREEER
jgi:hypothetical protein